MENVYSRKPLKVIGRASFLWVYTIKKNASFLAVPLTQTTRYVKTVRNYSTEGVFADAVTV